MNFFWKIGTPAAEQRQAFRLESQFFPHKDKFDPSGGTTVPGDEDLIADTSFRFAVCADSGYTTGGHPIKPLFVHRCGNGSGPGNGGFQGVTDLVHSGNDQNTFGAVDDGGNPVSDAVDVYHVTVHAQGVGTSEENIAEQAVLHGLSAFLRCCAPFPVNGTVFRSPDSGKQADLLGGQGTAPADGTALGNQLQSLFQGSFLRGAVISFKKPALQVFYKEFSSFIVVLLFWI